MIVVESATSFMFSSFLFDILSPIGRHISCKTNFGTKSLCDAQRHLRKHLAESFKGVQSGPPCRDIIAEDVVNADMTCSEYHSTTAYNLQQGEVIESRFSSPRLSSLA